MRPYERMALHNKRASIAELLDYLSIASGYVCDASSLLHRAKGWEGQDSAMACAEVTLDYAVILLDRVLDELREIHPVVAGARA